MRRPPQTARVATAVGQWALGRRGDCRGRRRARGAVNSGNGDLKIGKNSERKFSRRHLGCVFSTFVLHCFVSFSEARGMASRGRESARARLWTRVCVCVCVVKKTELPDLITFFWRCR